MNARHFNQLLSERIESFRYLSENALYPEVKEWADDCLDVLDQVKKDFQMCQEEPEPEKNFYVGNKVTYEGDAQPELRGHIALITRVHPYTVSVEFIDLEDGLWPNYKFYKSDVIPF